MARDGDAARRGRRRHDRRHEAKLAIAPRPVEQGFGRTNSNRNRATPPVCDDGLAMMLSPPSRAWTMGAMSLLVARQRRELSRCAASIWDASARPTGWFVRIFLGTHSAPVRETLSRSPSTSSEWGRVPSTRSPFAVCSGGVFGANGSIEPNCAFVDLRSIRPGARLGIETTAGY